MLHTIRPLQTVRLESAFERDVHLPFACRPQHHTHPHDLQLHLLGTPELRDQRAPSSNINVAQHTPVGIAPKPVKITRSSPLSMRCQQSTCTYVGSTARELASHVRTAHGHAASPPRSSSRLRQRSPPPRRTSPYGLPQSPGSGLSQSNASGLSAHRSDGLPHGIIHLRCIQPPSTWTLPKTPPVRLQDVVEDEELEIDVGQMAIDVMERTEVGGAGREDDMAPSPMGVHSSVCPTFSLSALEAIPEDEWSE